MKFARHETFPFREGWITKGFRKIEDDKMPDVFLRDDAMEQLGIGSNMVRALRYWMQAIGVTSEEKGKRGQTLTDFGSILYKYDRYLETDEALWLLHYHLVCNKELATTWYWFFNHFGYREFDEKVFLNELAQWVADQGEEVAPGSFKRDYDCLLNMYFKQTGKVVDPEEHLACPLQGLGLVGIIDPKQKSYRITRRNPKELNPNVILYMLVHFMKQKGYDRFVSIDSLYTEPNSLGKVLALSFAETVELLELLQSLGHIRLTKTAGLNQVIVENTFSTIPILEDCFRDRS